MSVWYSVLVTFDKRLHAVSIGMCVLLCYRIAPSLFTCVAQARSQTKAAVEFDRERPQTADLDIIVLLEHVVPLH